MDTNKALKLLDTIKKALEKSGINEESKKRLLDALVWEIEQN